MSRVSIITTEPLPLEGWPTTGAGLRAWGLAQGLRSRGHEVRLFMPEDAAAGFAPPEGSKPPTKDFPEWVATISRAKLSEDSRVQDCDVLVLQHWGIARELGEVHVPLAVDLAGPHLLERKLWGSPDFEKDLLEKLSALREADFATASGEDQRLYFLPFLAMAGWEISAEDPLPVIPFSLEADPAPAPPRADRFIYGGFFLPWQDPSAALETALEEMDAAGKGELIFIGGAHPRMDVSRGKFDTLAAKLHAHPRVRSFGPMAYEAYLALLREGGIALDLMKRNAERELAFTTRTVQYMACGLPVIHNNYSELAGWIQESGAGWTLDPNHGDSLRRLLRGLLKGEIDPAPRAAAARQLVAEHLNWEKTIEPLDAFCRAPRLREGKIAARLLFETRLNALESVEGELKEALAELNTLKGKRWVRWGLDLFSLNTPARWIAAVGALLIGLALIPVFWVSDRLGGSSEPPR